MSLWNPYAFTPTGQPVAPVAPPALRVIDGEATAQQLTMAQQAFVQFSERARLSVVPNPVEMGRLPDGTPYKIIDVAGVRTMMLWPSNGEERRSGVVIALSDLNGAVLAGHHTDGVPTRYLLTPKAKANRDATGSWLVRKLREPWEGGKAVQSTPNGKKYFTGIDGRSDFLYPYATTGFGSINERAYTIEDREALGIRQSGVEVFLSNDSEAPIPFILQDEDGKEYAAQLVFQVAGGITSVSLYVGSMEKTPGIPVGDLVATVTFPASVAVRLYAVSIRNDGREARAAARDGIEICNLTLQITKDSLDYTLSDRSRDSFTEYAHAPVVSINTVETTPTGSITYRRTNGNYVDPADGITKGGTGKTTQRNGVTKVFAFGPKGQATDTRATEDIFITEGTNDYEFREELVIGVGGTGFELSDIYEKITVINNCPELSDFLGDSAEASEAAVYREDTYSLHAEWTPTEWVAGVRNYSGNRVTHQLDYYGTVSNIFYDRYQQFAIYLDIVPPSSTVIQSLSGTDRFAWTSSTTTKPGKVVLKAKYKTSIVLDHELVISSAQPGSFIAYAASDPLTAALVVNLMRIKRMPSGANQRLASWIFMVDESGVKTIHDVMPSLPPDVCAIENRLLYSL